MEPSDAGSNIAPPPLPPQMRAALQTQEADANVTKQHPQPEANHQPWPECSQPTATSTPRNANTTAEDQKLRNRKSREKWKGVKTLQGAVASLARPRKLRELRAMDSADILQPEGGFTHLSGFQLAMAEHCAKTGKKVTCSNVRKTKVGASRLKLGLPLGTSDRNHYRYVCAGDDTGNCLFQADVWCR